MTNTTKDDTLKEFDITLVGVEKTSDEKESDDAEIRKRQGYVCKKYYEFTIAKETL